MVAYLYQLSSSLAVFATLQPPTHFPAGTLRSVKMFNIELLSGWKECKRGPFRFILTPGGHIVDEISCPLDNGRGEHFVIARWDGPGGPLCENLPARL